MNCPCSSRGTSSSHPTPRLHNCWKMNFPYIMSGVRNPTGSNTRAIKLNVPLFVHVSPSSGGRDVPQNWKLSLTPSQLTPNTLIQPISCSIPIIPKQGLLECHFVKFMPALLMSIFASCNITWASSSVSDPDNQSSTYKFSDNSVTTLDFGIVLR